MITAQYPRATSPAPSSASSGRRLSLTNRLSALGAKLTRPLSGNTEETYHEEKDKVSPTLRVIGLKERSKSRGREAFSTGRGGVGNIRQSVSASRTRPDSAPGPDDFSDSRGREIKSSAKIYSTGRGGAGNIRSPSRDQSKPAPSPIDASEQDIIRNHIAASQVEPVSSGRGGLGNISSRSRSRGSALAANPAVHSTGRGGAGNLLSGDANVAGVLDEAERKKLTTAAAGNDRHSTGRGGLANLASGPQPGIEQVVHIPGGTESTGRGGAGNMKHNN